MREHLTSIYMALVSILVLKELRNCDSACRWTQDCSLGKEALEFEASLAHTGRKWKFQHMVQHKLYGLKPSKIKQVKKDNAGGVHLSI